MEYLLTEALKLIFLHPIVVAKKKTLFGLLTERAFRVERVTNYQINLLDELRTEPTESNTPETNHFDAV